MKKIKYWSIAALIGLLIGVSFWWVSTEMKDRKDPLNKSDAFVYSNNAMLYWFELKSQKGKVKGILHEQKLMDGMGENPILKKKNSR
ncbi:hypothetical protein ACFSO7_23525 [Bacillus sp. CGMCC 1.16607]|uniref:hypothetical protein n=1 Tax=Bacillus sp. CGMCC 1.16607 TaxID=3351842 RepID=UPI0036359BF0